MSVLLKYMYVPKTQGSQKKALDRSIPQKHKRSLLWQMRIFQIETASPSKERSPK